MWEKYYKNGFIIGYCCSVLEVFLNLKEEKFDININDYFPNITDSIIKEFRDINKEDYDVFFKNHKELFINSCIYKAALEDFEDKLKKKKEKDKINYITKALKEINENILIDNNGLSLNVLFKYDVFHIYNEESIIPDIIREDKTHTRIEIANKLMSLEDKTIEEIKNILESKDNDGKYLELRCGRAILLFNNINNYAIYKILSVNINKPWVIINNESLEDMESLKYLDTDKYNRLSYDYNV